MGRLPTTEFLGNTEFLGKAAPSLIMLGMKPTIAKGCLTVGFAIHFIGIALALRFSWLFFAAAFLECLAAIIGVRWWRVLAIFLVLSSLGLGLTSILMNNCPENQHANQTAQEQLK
jgi:hypothetical protein